VDLYSAPVMRWSH